MPRDLKNNSVVARYLEADETILLSGDVIKINPKAHRQKRQLVLTDKAIYNFCLQAVFSSPLKRRIPVPLISQVVTSKKSLQLVMKVNGEYDIHLETNMNNQIVAALVAACKARGGSLALRVDEASDLTQVVINRYQATQAYAQQRIHLIKPTFEVETPISRKSKGLKRMKSCSKILQADWSSWAGRRGTVQVYVRVEMTVEEAMQGTEPSVKVHIITAGKPRKSSASADQKSSASIDNASSFRRSLQSRETKLLPKMNIVLLALGSLAHVDPFLHLGQLLQRDGHRVRMATHLTHRHEVLANNLEFYPLAPYLPSACIRLENWMQQSGGQLFPGSPEEIDFEDRIRMIETILKSTWLACTETDPGDVLSRCSMLRLEITSTQLEISSAWRLPSRIYCHFALGEHDAQVCRAASVTEAGRVVWEDDTAVEFLMQEEEVYEGLQVALEVRSAEEEGMHEVLGRLALTLPTEQHAVLLCCHEIRAAEGIAKEDEPAPIIGTICISSTLSLPANAEPMDTPGESFVADAIISSLDTYGHIHCAEALHIPLQLVALQPFTATREFPHPLAGYPPIDTDAGTHNVQSYSTVDAMVWKATQGVVNAFRCQLDLPQLSEEDAGMLNTSQVPCCFMWDDALCPRPKGWGQHLEIIGSSQPLSAMSWEPPEDLVAFCKKGDQPIWMDLQNMDDATAQNLSEMAATCAADLGYYLVLSFGLKQTIPYSVRTLDHVYVLEGGAQTVMQQSWLLERSAAVVQEGEMRRVAAAMRAGRPAMLLAELEEHHFWAERAFLSGAGTSPCSRELVTPEILRQGFQELMGSSLKVEAQRIAEEIRLNEDPIQLLRGAFYDNLPVVSSVCDVSIFMPDAHPLLAHSFVPEIGLKMNCMVAAVVREELYDFKIMPRYQYGAKTWVLQQAPLANKSRRGKIIGALRQSVRRAKDHIIPSSGMMLINRADEGAILEKQQNAPTHMNIQVNTDVYRALDKRRKCTTMDVDLAAISPSRKHDIMNAYTQACRAVKAFQILDKDGSGFLEIHEGTKDLLQASGILESLMDGDDLFGGMDVLRDGKINFTEFCWAMKRCAINGSKKSPSAGS